MPKWVMVIIGLAIAITVLTIAYRILNGAGGRAKIGKIEVSVSPSPTPSASSSLGNPSKKDIKLDYVTTSNTAAAIVFDPPSNVRIKPNGKIICTVTSKGSIRVYGKENGWFRTDVCGKMGFIHKSQVSFNPKSIKQ